MLSFLGGALLGFITNLVTIGFYFIEAIILTIVFNNMAPAISEKMEIVFPFDHTSVWFTWGVFILCYFIGKLIQMIVPSFATTSNTNTKLEE